MIDDAQLADAHAVSSRICGSQSAARPQTQFSPLGPDPSGANHNQWTALVRQLEPVVHAVAWRCGVRGTDLDDVAQTVWLAAWQHVGQLRDPAALRAWLVAITRNAARNHAMSGRRLVLVDFSDNGQLAAHGIEDGHQGDVGPGVDDGLRRAELVDAIRGGLAELNSSYRELLLMLASDPPTPYREISDRLRVPLGSIGPTRARLLKKLAGTSPVRRLLSEAVCDVPAAAA